MISDYPQLDYTSNHRWFPSKNRSIVLIKSHRFLPPIKLLAGRKADIHLMTFIEARPCVAKDC